MPPTETVLNEANANSVVRTPNDMTFALDYFWLDEKGEFVRYADRVFDL